jgi:glyoxylase-like metal-dependent hydrolase (beta-lactamase superfamily II)
VLLSESGSALIIDYGYDFTTGLPDGTDRSSRRPWLATLPQLKRDFGIDRVEVAIPTHYHDDHVAGFNLLREIEGTEVWAPENMAAIFERPRRFDLPCLWWEPIGFDRVLGFDRPFTWHEYELAIHPLPGHTLFAVAIAFVADGRRIIATGDQQNGLWVPGERPETLNYQYRNLFRIDDFVRSAELYRRLEPDLMISGHWLPRPVTTDYLDMLLAAGTDLARLHRELLPLDEIDFGATGFGARIEPYRSELRAGSTLAVSVSVRNPLPSADTVTVRLVTPPGWSTEPPNRAVAVPSRSDASVEFSVAAPATAPQQRRARIAADVTVGSVRFGQQAEALVDVVTGL